MVFEDRTSCRRVVRFVEPAWWRCGQPVHFGRKGGPKARIRPPPGRDVQGCPRRCPSFAGASRTYLPREGLVDLETGRWFLDRTSPGSFPALSWMLRSVRGPMILRGRGRSPPVGPPDGRAQRFRAEFLALGRWLITPRRAPSIQVGRHLPAVTVCRWGPEHRLSPDDLLGGCPGGAGTSSVAERVP